MALHVKFHKRNTAEFELRRFRSAVKLFDTLSKSITLNPTEVYLFIGDSTDDTFEKHDYTFGLVESHFRKQLQLKKDLSKNIGLAIDGDLLIDAYKFRFFFELKPASLCHKDRFDLEFDILPNVNASIIEDLEKYTKNLKEILLDRIKTYNNIVDNDSFTIMRAVLCKSFDEYGPMQKWDYFFSYSEKDFLGQVINSSDKLKKQLAFGNVNKFVNQIVTNDTFAFILSDYADEYKVKIAEGSISIIPKKRDSMPNFVNQVAQDLNKVAEKLYPNEDKARKIIDSALLEIQN